MALTRSLLRYPGALAVLLIGTGVALSCAVLKPSGSTVHITAEKAIIVWDAEKRTEHFIRQAQFSADRPDFGFLVPTPSRPALSEVDPAVFDRLSEATAPQTEYRNTYHLAVLDVLAPLAGTTSTQTFATVGAAIGGGVAVLEQKRLGDLDYAILAAEDSGALQEWLKKHGYPSSEGLQTWLDWYVQNRWVLTAFKVTASDPSGGEKPRLRPAKLMAVRFSFQTDRPFYPYREPAFPPSIPSASGEVVSTPSNPSPDRHLTVYCLASKRMEATLGSTPPWVGEVVWSDRLPEGNREKVLDTLQLSDALTSRGEWWLTEFSDASTPRLGTDEVYFAPASNPNVVHRPPNIVHTPVAVDSLVLVGVFVLGLIGILVFTKTTPSASGI